MALVRDFVLFHHWLSADVLAYSPFHGEIIPCSFPSPSRSFITLILHFLMATTLIY
jgi:hypothetical protein